MFLVPLAFAADPGDAFACPALTEPADGRWYADPWEMSPAVYDTLGAWVEDQYDADCPGACERRNWVDCAYSADCVTSAGAHIVVDYAYDIVSTSWPDATEDWEVTVQTADGVSLTLSSRYVYDYWYGGSVLDEQFDWSWSVTWSGTIHPELPSEADVSVEGSWQEYYSEYSSGSEYESWNDGTCAWATQRSMAGEFVDWNAWETSYEMEVDGHSLQLEPESSCTAARLATLDGVTMAVDPVTWERLEDADGDGTPADLDCDDADGSRSPCLEDIVCDGIDQDCDGTDADDWDGDGYVAECAGGDDCDDADHSVHPDRTDAVGDGIDANCDGVDGVAQEPNDSGNLDLPEDSSPPLADSGLPSSDTGDPEPPADSGGADAPSGCGRGCAGLLLLLPLARRRR